jgi:hypothetical protein
MSVGGFADAGDMLDRCWAITVGEHCDDLPVAVCVIQQPAAPAWQRLWSGLAPREDKRRLRQNAFCAILVRRFFARQAENAIMR